MCVIILSIQRHYKGHLIAQKIHEAFDAVFSHASSRDGAVTGTNVLSVS